MTARRAGPRAGNAPKRAGTQFEGDVAGWLRLRGGPFRRVERAALYGTRDRGDLTGFPELELSGLSYGLVVGCKNEKTIDLAGYMDDLSKQRHNLIHAFPDLDAALSVEVVKRRDWPTSRAYAVTELEHLAGWLEALYGAADLRESAKRVDE